MAERRKKTACGGRMRKTDLLKWLLALLLVFLGMWPLALLLLLVWTLLAGRKRRAAARAADTAGGEQETPAGGKTEKKSPSFWWLKRVLLGGCSIYWDFFLPPPLQAMGGGVRFCLDQRREMAKHRAEKYREAMGEDAAVPLDELAKRMNMRRDKLQRDLGRLIEKKFSCSSARRTAASISDAARLTSGSSSGRSRRVSGLSAGVKKVRGEVSGLAITSRKASRQRGRAERIARRAVSRSTSHPISDAPPYSSSFTAASRPVCREQLRPSSEW